MTAELDVSDPHSFARFVRGLGSGVVATVAQDGAPQAAFVALAALDDGTLVLDSMRSARKIQNLSAEQRVAVVIGEGDVSVQVEGVATVVDGVERVRPAREYESQHPGSRAMSEELAVVVIHPRWLRVYDTSRTPPTVVETHW